MSTNIFYPHAIVLGGVEITQIERLPLNPNIQTFALRSASGTFPGLIGSHTVQPDLNFSTTQIKSVLDVAVMDNVAAAFDGTNVDVEWRRATNLAGKENIATPVHTRTRATKSLLTWESISASNAQLATIESMLKFIADDPNPPLTTANNIALSAATAVQHAYTLGPSNVVAGALNSDLCVQSVNWSNNISYKMVECSGSGYTCLAIVETVEPTITLTVEDVSQPLALLNSGADLTSFTWYLRRKGLTAGSPNVPDTTPQHIRFTSTVGSAFPGGPREIMIKPHSFAINTASAIV